jgi:hypothetical protein
LKWDRNKAIGRAIGAIGGAIEAIGGAIATTLNQGESQEVMGSLGVSVDTIQ